MTSAIMVWGLAAFAVSAVLAGLTRRFVVSWGILDVPNDRSSHRQATPRGGGIAIAVTVSAALMILALRGSIDHQLFWALLLGGLAVATVGFMDDRGGVPAGLRLTVHLLAALWAVHLLGGFTTVQLGEHVTHLSRLTGTILAVLGIGWTVNLFNFMDGTDGIAASEALFVAAAGALLAMTTNDAGVAAAAWVFAFACGGFLGWNWAPAKMFLGDVGSGYLGYVIAVLALADSARQPAHIWAWLVLGGVFFVDASVTLVRRAWRGERLHEAHRQHAYQRLARRWGSHAKVAAAVLLVNLLWLFPWAIFAARHPPWALPTAFLSLLPLVLVAVAVGAGRDAATRDP